jgi:hypothetical protein
VVRFTPQPLYQSYTYASHEQLSSRHPVVFSTSFVFLMPYNLRLAFPTKETGSLAARRRATYSFVSVSYRIWSPIHLPCFAVTRNVFVTACFVRKYSCCVPGFEELCHLDISKWSGSGHFCKITGQTFRQRVKLFAVRISDVFAYVEAPGDEGGNH